jgi:hypothetical protein
MKVWNTVLILVLVATVLAGCGGDPSSSAEEASVQPAASGQGNTYTSTVLDDSYEEALPASSQLALGTFKLEETEHAVTPEQASALLPLWQAIEAGSLQSDAETIAVLKQIEGTMTADQLAAIAAMQLSFEDMGAWMQEQGVGFRPPAGAGEGQNPFGNISEEERAAMRATRQAGGGGMPGQGGPFGNLSEEERAAMRATAEASGSTFPGAGAPGTEDRAGRGQLAALAGPLVELLTERAAE